MKQLLFVLGNVAASFLLSALQAALLPPGWALWTLWHYELVLIVAPLYIFLGMWYPNAMKALCEAWVVQLGALTAPFVVPLIMTPTGPTSVRWRIYNTLDDQGGSQGMTEPQVADVYKSLGWRWKTFYWLAGRNVCYGLANRFRPNYDFASAKFYITDRSITMTWGSSGLAIQYAFPGFSGPRVMFGYKVHAYLNSLDPLVLNPHIDPPDIDVGGVPFFTVRMK